MSGAGTPLYSIIVATLDEEGSITECIERILKAYHGECEVIVVDGGTDRTGEIVGELARDNPAVRYVRNRPDRGKGHAIRVGVGHARAPIHAQIDADLQFLPEELPRLTEPLRRGVADVALGSRFTGGARRRPGSTPTVRTLGNKLVSGYASLLFGHRMTDVQAGMKAWTSEAIRRIGLRSDSYAYEVEIPAKALLRGLRVIDVPITTDARQSGESKVHVIRDGLTLVPRITLFRLGLGG